MKSNMGLIMNIVLGIVGAAIASAILSYFGIVFGGWIGYLISGFIGAFLLIWIARTVRELEKATSKRSNDPQVVDNFQADPSARQIPRSNCR
jgi:uncharacterized membrane protein YeaQ/YmgE (transglycosylase-associated protein family)